MGVTIRPLRPDDRAQWDRLFAGYAEFYQVAQTAEMRDRVWGWIFDPAQETEALVAESEGGGLVGLAHFRAYSRPLRAVVAGYLDDLFVAPEARGGGVALALIDAVRAEAVQRGWSVVRWTTAEDNYRARSVYDRVAERTKWITTNSSPECTGRRGCIGRNWCRAGGGVIPPPSQQRGSRREGLVACHLSQIRG